MRLNVRAREFVFVVPGALLMRSMDDRVLGGDFEALRHRGDAVRFGEMTC